MLNPVRALIGAIVVCSAVACGQTGIRNTTVRAPTNVPRPERILVYDFAVSAEDVKEYQGIMRQQPTIKDPAEREIGRASCRERV